MCVLAHRLTCARSDDKEQASASSSSCRTPRRSRGTSGRRYGPRRRATPRVSAGRAKTSEPATTAWASTRRRSRCSSRRARRSRRWTTPRGSPGRASAWRPATATWASTRPRLWSRTQGRHGRRRAVKRLRLLPERLPVKLRQLPLCLLTLMIRRLLHFLVACGRCEHTASGEHTSSGVLIHTLFYTQTHALRLSHLHQRVCVKDLY